MNNTVSLTLEQIDTINLSLEKALAVAQMVAECGGKRKPGEDEPTPASLFMVMADTSRVLNSSNNAALSGTTIRRP